VLEIGQDVKVKVLDIDRERQRISLGLKQTQSDPWQQVVEAYNEGDVVQGKVTKVVTFGAFVEILPGVEGLVHISELAQHHVENPREVVSQGDLVNVKVIEIDADRRRLSLSLKRVEEGETVQPRADGAPLAANLDLSEDVFGDAPATDAAPAEGVEVVDESIAEGALEAVPELDEEPSVDGADQPLGAEPVAEAEPEPEPEPEVAEVAESPPAGDEPADQPE
jgi:small subunit ribosomal protein S1